MKNVFSAIAAFMLLSVSSVQAFGFDACLSDELLTEKDTLESSLENDKIEFVRSSELNDKWIKCRVNSVDMDDFNLDVFLTNEGQVVVAGDELFASMIDENNENPVGTIVKEVVREIAKETVREAVKETAKAVVEKHMEVSRKAAEREATHGYGSNSNDKNK